MSDAKLTFIENAVSDMHARLLTKDAQVESGLKRYVEKAYIDAQKKRWMTEGESEGDHWDPLNPLYEKRKKTKFAAYPGKGTKMLIATGHLLSGVTLENPEYGHSMISGRHMEIAITVPYAVYVNEQRDFTSFSEKTRQSILKKLKNFYFNMGGDE